MGTRGGLAAILLLATLLVGVAAQQKVQITFDDGISYIAAAGNTGRFETGRPAGRWVPASDWQAFWRPDALGAFARIARDLAHHDIHPPLYFWLLHVWGWLFGNELLWAPLLNLLLVGAAVPLLYATCRQAGASTQASLVATAGWTWSGSTLPLCFQVRQYALLALVGIAFVRTYVAFRRRPSPANTTALLLLGAAGLLTHFHFALLVAAAILHHALRRRARAWALHGLATLGSVALCVALHPALLEVGERIAGKRRAWTGAFEPGEALVRLGDVAATWVELVMPLEAALVVGLAAAYGVFRHGIPKLQAADRLPRIDPTAWQLGALTLAGIAALFVAGQSPEHAMSYPYVAVGAPALFVGLASALDHLQARLSAVRGRWLALCLLAGFAAYGVASTAKWVLRQRSALESHRTPGGRLIVDRVDRGHLPALLWQAHPETRVYANTLAKLLASPPTGLDAAGPVVVFDTTARERSPADGRALCALYRAAGREPRATDERVFRAARSGSARTAARVYRLEPIAEGPLAQTPCALE